MKRVDGKTVSTVTDEAILGFFGEYRWLSNFHPCRVDVEGLKFPSSEHAYMAMKTDVLEERKAFTDITLSGKEAKELGQKVTLIPNWDDIRISMMLMVLYAKFMQNDDLKSKLLATGDKYLEETNYWNDTFWGKCNGAGYNHLGECLMRVRSILRRGGESELSLLPEMQ